jgi:hypothetical protein
VETEESGRRREIRTPIAGFTDAAYEGVDGAVTISYAPRTRGKLRQRGPPLQRTVSQAGNVWTAVPLPRGAASDRRR